MSYATVDDMVSRFGAEEIIRASTPDGVPAVAVGTAVVQQTLDDATSIIDGFLRNRYNVPLDIAPPEINRACCILARYDLSSGGARSPNEDMRKGREETTAWLRCIARGDVKLGVEEMAPGQESFATFSTRPQVFQDQGTGNCGGLGFFNSGGGAYGGPL